MKAVVLTGIGKVEIRDVPVPKITGQDDVLLKIAAVGICGSDIHYFREGRIGDQVVAYPFSIGHECTAVVEAVGEAVSTLKPGDPVVLEPQIACGHCSQCLNGRPHTCYQAKFFGCPGQVPGALREYVVVPEAFCFPIPGKLNLTEAVFAEPLSIGLYASVLSDLSDGQKIGILGAGPIGLSVLNAVQECQGNITYVTDKLDYRIAKAASLGAHWTGNPETTDIVGSIRKIEPEYLDTVFECCGDQDALNQAVQLLKPAGKLIIVGIPDKDRVDFDIHEMRRKETVLINVHRQNGCLQKAIDLLQRKRETISSLITHVFEPEKSQEAFALVSDYKDHVIKAVIQFQ